MLTIAIVVAGLVLLIAGGAMLVRGATDIARNFGVSPLVVGLTVVGFGTSAPELVVNIVGAVEGETDLAFGNVVGSNITNLALVLGMAAVIAPISIQGQLVRREIPLLLLATTIMTVMALDGPLEGRAAVIGRAEAVTLLLLFCIFIYVNVLDYLLMEDDDVLLVEIGTSTVIHRKIADRFPWLIAAAGIGLLFVGGELTVRGAIGVATLAGIPSTVVGLYLVAIGTSMPELVTSIIAASRKEPDLALGNVVGSNLFNSMIVLPATGLIRPIPVPDGGIGDLAFSLLLAAALIPVFFLGEKRFGRATGVLFLVAYLAYAWLRIAP